MLSESGSNQPETSLRPFAPVLPAALLLVLGSSGARAADGSLNLYEWTGPAPIVVAARSLGHDGKHVEVEIERVFRGDVEPAAIVRVDVRRANRERSEHADLDPLHLDDGDTFLLLLRPGRKTSPDRPPLYELVRGVRGARPLPAEGAPAILDAVDLLIGIQELGDDQRVWDRLADLLRDDRPLLVEIALEQLVKFRRGAPDHLEPVRRLLSHADPEIRRLSSELLGQLADRHPSIVTGAGRLRDELAGRARRDPEPAVRIAAATALDAFDGPAVDEVLEEMASEDPNQNVRYVAETLIYDRRARSRAPGGGSN
jgi:hypothetical protein